MFLKYKITNKKQCIQVPLISTYGTELQDEYIAKQYFEQKKEELITPIVDYEKICFAPYYLNNQNQYNAIYSITFNLFLRDRSGSDNWTTSDEKYWNQYKSITEGNTYIELQNNLGADLLYNKNDVVDDENKDKNKDCIGFEEDDIKFQKKNLSKSFIRLSFYNTNNPLNQMLLFYSTIFFDTNVLFNNYINGKTTRASFTVYNRYNRDKSSEGFYLYLFPEYVGKTIYMKVEFNHAGYGRTIPLVHINDNKLPLSYMLTKDDTGETVTRNDLTALYKDMYIPIDISYDNINNDYIYTLGDGVKVKNNGEDTVINLYEPKIN